MDLKDDVDIPAPKAAVYAALNDPEILKQCIPGCEELIKHSDTELEAKVSLKIGPVKAKFTGNVTLDTSGAPDNFSLTGEGSGGAAGFAKGKADVTLEETADGTRLSYNAHADMGGKIAQLGSRLIDSTAKKLAGQFFNKFAETVATAQGAPDSEAENQSELGTSSASAAQQASQEGADGSSSGTLTYVLIGVAILIGAYALFG
ncbi:CoxG family protein [Coralliovum pocilloporae]|uniref:CoxG family protein n=1 Tax=Coralliovum pocilloporae TaxID=3066369 RepID=UPI0033079630